MATRENFVARFWRGGYSLPVSYWLFGILITFALSIFGLFVSRIVSDRYNPLQIFATLCVVWLVVVIISIWQWGGVWRSADRYVAERRQTGKGGFWGRLAQFMVVIGAMRVALELVNNAVPQLSETWRMAFLGDPGMPDFKVTLAGDGSEVQIFGGFKYGLAENVATVLKAAPNAKWIGLHSPGGRIGEAEAVYRTIKERNLNTYVEGECSSACVIAFLAGTERYLMDGAKLGFHSPEFAGDDDIVVNEARRTFASILAGEGVDRKFLSDALSVPTESMWYPEANDLIKYGVVTNTYSADNSNNQKSLEEELNKDLPKKIDEITTLTKLQLNGKVTVYSFDRFEEYTRRRSFREFRVEQATGFKRHLSSLDAQRGGKRLSKATVASTLHALRDFFRWLADQRGFRNRIRTTDADYFRPSRSDEAIARAPRLMLVPTIEQVRRMMNAMPDASPMDRRNRAVVALTILTGARDNAVASVRLKHLDLEDRQLFQDAREVRTKFSKTFPTWFFPVGEDFVATLAEWKGELEKVHSFGADDPLFPKTTVSFGPEGQPLAPRLLKECWANADPIRKAFRDACRRAGLPDFKPHSFRHALAQLGGNVCRTPAEYKAWSQNLGHEGALVTLTSYGTLPGYAQRDLISKVGMRVAAEESSRAQN